MLENMLFSTFDKRFILDYLFFPLPFSLLMNSEICVYLCKVLMLYAKYKGCGDFLSLCSEFHWVLSKPL